MKILAIDVGMGTQDILLYDSKKNMENCFKIVLPSQTQIIAGRIAKETRLKNDIVLIGETMGGGPCAGAIKRHLEADLNVYATEKAALTLNDSIGKVKEMGVNIISEEEARELKAQKIRMCDIDEPALEQALSLFDISMPDKFAVAVQDHGYSPEISNRKFRFEYFREKMENCASLDSFVYKDDIPQRFTRMKAVQSSLPGALLMDTGIAAIRGALLDSNAKQPCLAVNIGNGHTLAGIIDDGEIIALMEHHTHQMTSEKLDDLLERFCNGTLGFNEIYDDGGHGCYIRRSIGIDSIGSMLVTGPRRKIMCTSGLDLHFAAPYGDMMLTGCFGLVDSYLNYVSGYKREHEKRIA